MSNPWQYDHHRQAHFHWSADDDCFIYSNGLRLDRNYQPVQEASVVNSSREDPRVPRSGGATQTTYPAAYQAAQQTAQQTAQQPTVSWSDHTSSGSYNLSTLADALPQQHTVNLGSEGFESVSFQHPVTQQQVRVERNLQAYPGTHQDYRVLTEQNLLNQSRGAVYATRRLAATHGEEETIDAKFKVRRPGHKFFKVGKVFKVLWPEIAGDLNRGITLATVTHGTQIGLKMRWFVVIREGWNSASCLPIQTYNRRGVAKRNIPKNTHAIIYSGSHEPKPSKKEKPSKGEVGMLPSIRVRVKKPTDKMDPMSRVNFAKIYTVEHLVKVYDFGSVDPQYRNRLLEQFNSIWRFDATQPTNLPEPEDEETGEDAEEEEGEEDEDEDDEDEEDEEDEDEDEDEDDDPEEYAGGSSAYNTMRTGHPTFYPPYSPPAQ